MSLRKASKVPGRGARTIKQVDPVQRRKAIIRSAASYAVEALETRTMLSLVAQWKFDESSGATALDSSGHNLDATVHNGTSFVSSGRGDGGNAVYFNGSTQYGDVGDSDLLDNSSQMSFSFWVNPSLLDGQPRAVLSKRVNNNDNHAYSIFFHTGNKLYVDIVGSNNRFSSNTVFSTNTWYHVAVVYDGSASTQQVKLYVNGVLDKAAAETSTFIPNYASNLYLAQHNLNYSTKFQGKLDDVRIYNNAITSDEVSRFVTPPTITSAAAISPSPVTDTSATLSVLGSDSQGESALTYTWSVLSMPSGATAPTFSTNGTNSAKNTAVTFSKAGSYTLRAAINNGYSVSISDVTFTVSQTISSILVTPSTVTVVPSGTAQFTASARDQFGNALATQPTFAWSVQSGGGSINSSGLYTASSSGGNATVAATASGVTETAGVNTVLPVVHLKMDESSGTTAADPSGNVDISLVNGPTFVASNRPGGNNALSFNAANQYGYHTDSGVLDNTEKLTVALWVKANVLDGNAHGLVAKRVGYLTENSFSLLFNTDNRFYVDFGDYAYRAASNTIFDAGQWYHIAAVFDGTQPAASRVKIYVNGALDKTASNGLTSIPDFASNLYIGALQPGYAPLNGMIDDVRIYRDALDGKQLMDMLGVPAEPTGLTAAKVTDYFRHVSLAWTDNADNETGYRVERRAGFTAPWTTLQTLGANATSYLDTTAAPGTMYYYRVVAFNNSGDSAEAKIAVNTAELPVRIGSSTSNPSGVLTLNIDTTNTNYTWVKEYKVDWGDGQITGVITGTPPSTLNHAYATPGSYTPVIKFVDAGLDWPSPYEAHLNYDSTLGSVGKIVTPLPTLSTTYPWTGAKAVTALANGQYLVAGHNTWAGFAVARYNANGALDNNFGNGGWSIIDFGGSYQHNVSSIAVQSDGKIVVAGDVNLNNTYDWAVARFNADGSVDSTFGNTGIPGASKWNSGSTSERGNAVAVDSNGRILVSGFADRDMAVVAFTSSGQIDGSFGNSGITKANLGGDTQDISYGINLQADSKIIVSGRSDLQVAVVRFDTNGSRDMSFNGNTGKYVSDLATNGGFEALYHITVDETTGSILLVGEVDANIALVRLTNSGTIDTTFGGGIGRVLTPFERNYLGWTALVDGNNIYVGGMVNRSPASFLVARYSTSGVLDTSFGDNGAIETTITQDAVRSMVLTLTKSGGTTTAVGTVQTNNYDDFALVRMRDTHSVQVGVGTTLNTTLTASADNANAEIDLAWSVSGPGIISGFKIERSVNGGSFGLHQQIDDIAVREWEDSAVVRGTTYQYRVVPFGATDFAPSNITTVTLSFGANVTGMVWLDGNRNARLDQDGLQKEAGSAGHTVYADLDDDAIFDAAEPSAASGVDGAFSLWLPIGSYTLRVDPTAGFRQSYPTSGGQDVEVLADQNVTGIYFGVATNAAPVLGALTPPPVTIDPYAPPGRTPNAIWGLGDVFMTTWNDKITREHQPDGAIVRMLSANGLAAFVFDADGNLYAADWEDGTVVKISADGTNSEVIVEGLTHPESLALDASGNLYVGCSGIADYSYNRVSYGGIHKFDTAHRLVGRWLEDVWVDRLDLSYDQHTVYFNSASYLPNGTTRNNLYSFDTNTGVLSAPLTTRLADGGVYAQALQLAGENVDQRVDLPASVFSAIDGDFTLSVWFKWSGEGAAGAHRIFDLHDDQWTATQGKAIWAAATTTSEGDNALSLNFTQAGWDSATTIQAGTFVSDEWYQVTARLASGTLAFFINGEKIGEAPTSMTLSTMGLTQATLGNSTFNSTDALNGRIDEAGVWSRALTDAEVSSIYHGQGIGPSLGRTAYWTFDGSGEELSGGVSASFPAGPTFTSEGDLSGGALRTLPDGRILVADLDNIKLLGADGQLLRTYDAPGDKYWYALNLDPDGLSFWAGDAGGLDFTIPQMSSADVARFDIESGQLLARFNGVIRSANGNYNFPRSLGIYGEETAGTVRQGDDFVYRVPASDPDNDPIRFQFVGNNHGATIEANTGVLRWTPTIAGTYSFTVRVTDQFGATDEDSFNVQVVNFAGGENHGPQFVTNTLSDARVGVRYQNRVVATDPDGDRLIYSVIDSAGVSIDAATGLLTWTPTAEELERTSKRVTIRATDARGAFADRSFNINILAPNLGNENPSFGDMDSTWYFQAGRESTFDVSAEDGQTLVLTVSGLLPGMSVTPLAGGHSWQIKWTPTTEQAGEHQIVLLASDGQGGHVRKTIDVVVAARIVASPRVLVVTPGSTIDFLGDGLLDADGNRLLYRKVTGLTFEQNNSGYFNAGANPTIYYAGQSEGIDIVRINLNDLGNSTGGGWDRVKIVVSSQPARQGVVATGEIVVENQVANFAGGLNGFIGSFYDDRTDIDPSNYSVSIDWGDGSSLDTNAYVVREINSELTDDIRSHLFNVVASHTYAAEGNYQVAITVTRAGQSFSFSSPAGEGVTVRSATVGLDPLGINAVVGQEFNGIIATFTDSASQSDATHFEAQIDWGDGTHSTGTITRRLDGVYLVRGIHTYKYAALSGAARISIYETDDGSKELRASAAEDVNIDLSALPAPTGVIVTAISSTQIEVKWNPVVGAFGYVIRRFNPDGTVFDLPDATQVTTSNPYYSQNLNPGQRYGIQVLASDPWRTLSAPSAIVYVTTLSDAAPDKPTGVVATAVSPTKVKLTWANGKAQDSTITSWDILRASSADGVTPPTSTDYVTIDNVAVPQYWDDGALPSHHYWYKVVAVRNSTTSDPSDAAEAITGIPGAPTNLQAGYAGYYPEQLMRRVGLKWDAVEGVDLLGYDIYRGTQAGFSLNASTLIGTSADPRYTDDISGSSSGGLYYYAVRAVYAGFDGGEISSLPSTRISVDTQNDPTIAPSSPTSFSVGEFTADHVTLTWSDNSLDEAGFDIYRRDFGTSSWGQFIGRLTADATSFTDTSVLPSEDYEYQIVAHNRAGTSVSPPLRVTMPSVGEAPSAPTNLRAGSSQTTHEKILVQWDAPASSSVAVSGYFVYRLNADGNYVRLNSTRVTGTSYLDTGLRGAASYGYKVVAVSATGSPSTALTGTLLTNVAPDELPYLQIVSPTAFAGMGVDFGNEEIQDGRIRKVTPVKIIVDAVNGAGTGFKWELSLRPLGPNGQPLPGQDIQLASGEQLVGSKADNQAKTVYNLDPSLFPSGQYQLVLSAQDEDGETTPQVVTVSLFSNNKFGNLVLPVTDLQVDVPGGQPLVVRRVYDSSRADELLDFGYGWRLEVSDSAIRTTARTGSSARGGTNTLRQGDLVYVNLPGGGQYVFQFLPVPNNYTGTGVGIDPYGLAYSQYYIQFIAVDGSNATLSVKGDIHDPDLGERIALEYDRVNKEFHAADGTGDLSYDPANPAFGGKYFLTTADGTQYILSASSGKLQRVKDTNGNVVQYRQDGMSEGGLSLQYERNGPGGTISRVRVVNSRGDVLGNPVEYSYNDLADETWATLKEVTNRVADTTSYRYADSTKPHLLTQVVDPRHIIVLTAQYDATGRLISLKDARNQDVGVKSGTSDGASGGEIVVEPGSNQNETENVYDERGNVVRQIRTIKNGTTPVGYQVTVFEYDYFSAGITSELTQVFDPSPSGEKKAGISAQNALIAMREYAPFTVDIAQADDRFTQSPTQLLNQTQFYSGQNADTRLPQSQTTYVDPTTRRITEFLSYDQGKPQQVKVTTQKLENSVWVNKTTTTTRSIYYADGNLRYQFDNLGYGTEYIYTTKEDGVPAGMLRFTYRARVNPLNSSDQQRLALNGQWYSDADDQAVWLILSENTYYTHTDTPKGQYAGSLKSSRSGEGRTPFYMYDDQGRVTRTYSRWVNPDNSSEARWVVDSSYYDSEGRVTRTAHTVYSDSGPGGAPDGVLALDPINTELGLGNLQIVETAIVSTVETRTQYDQLGRVYVSTDQFGGDTTNTYDLSGNLIRVQYGDGTETRSVFDELGRLVWQTERFYSTQSEGFGDPVVATETLYDSLGRVVETRRWNNIAVHISDDSGYNAEPGATAYQKTEKPDTTGNQPLSRETTIFDSKGRVVATERYSGAATSAYLRTGTIYTDAGQVRYSGILKDTTSTPAQNWLGHFTTADFVSYTSSTPDQLDGVGNVYDRVTDALGHHTDTYKDHLGRVTRTVFHDDTFTQTLYVPEGEDSADTFDGVTVDHPTAAEGWLGVPVGGRYEIRIAQRKAYENGNFTDPDPNKRVLATHYLYDYQGRLTDVWLPAVDDATTTSTEKLRPHWHYDYDADGNQTGQTDPNGHVTNFTYDHAGQRTSRTLPGGKTESWTYDQFGRVRMHVDFKGQTTLNVYDFYNGGRQLNEVRYASDKTVTPDMNPFYPVGEDPLYDEMTAYVYDDDAGLPVEEQTRLGRLAEVREYFRDGAGVVQSVRTEHTAYDPITGGVSRVTAPEGIISHEYDPATGLLVRTWTNHNDTAYAYDNRGRLEHVYTLLLNDTRSATYDEWDSTTRQFAFTGGTPLDTAYSYDLAGNLHTVTQSNGVTTTYSYNDLNRLEIETVAKGTPKLFEQAYTLLANGQRDYVIEKRFDSAGNLFSTTKVDWDYDDDGRLIKETRDQGDDGQDGEDYVAQFGYDLNGNRYSKAFNSANNAKDEAIAYSYNANDQLAAEGPDGDADGVPDLSTATSYTYDLNGSMHTKTRDGDTARYGWDLRNRLVSIDANDDTDLNDAGDARYRYDSAAQRISQTDGGGDGSTRYFINDRANPTGYPQILEEKVGASADLAQVVRSYVRGQRVEAQSDAANGVLYFLRDGHGSTRSLVDGSGAVVEQEDYQAFGESFGFDAATSKTIQLFAGDAEFDPTSGFYYHDKRWRQNYRFISLDDFPGIATDPQTLHKYLYASSNPIQFSDPSGHAFLLDALSANFIGIARMVGNALVTNKARKTAFDVLFSVAIGSTVRAALGQDPFSWNELTKDVVSGIVSGPSSRALKGLAKVGGPVLSFAAKYGQGPLLAMFNVTLSQLTDLAMGQKFDRTKFRNEFWISVGLGLVSDLIGKAFSSACKQVLAGKLHGESFIDGVTGMAKRLEQLRRQIPDAPIGSIFETRILRKIAEQAQLQNDLAVVNVLSMVMKLGARFEESALLTAADDISKRIAVFIANGD